MQAGQRVRDEPELFRRAGSREQRLEVLLHIEEVDRARFRAPLLRAARAHRDTGQEVGLRALAEARTMLEQADTVLLAALILERGLDEAGPQRRAHDGH